MCLSSRVLLAVLLSPYSGAASRVVSLRGGTGSVDVNTWDVPLPNPIDFEAALSAARRRMQRPEASIDDALRDAGKVLVGEKVFEPVNGLSGAERCNDWII